MTPRAKSDLVKALGREAGFNRVGIVHPAPSARATYYRDWLARGQMGAMTYLAENAALRADSSKLLPGARSVVCVALNYGRRESEPAASAAPLGRVASYARGDDYHRVVLELLRQVAAALRERIEEPFESRICVDTAPVLERELAAAAGLGWIGKNTLLLHEREGSYCFLGELFLTLELEADEPQMDHCGSCTRCLDACPTRAFPAPYEMDASRCISYFTIEKRGEIPAEFHTAIGDWVFGCDVCQAVCPFNARAPLATQPQIAAERLPARLDLTQLAALGGGAWRRMTRNSATWRATRSMWRRNARIALANARGA